MASVVKYSVVKNTSNPWAALTGQDALVQGAGGQQYNINIVKRVLIAGDIGANAGQTRHDNGLLVTQVEGCRILSVVSLQVVHPVAAAAGSWQTSALNLSDTQDAYAQNGGYQVNFKISADGTQLFIKDTGTVAACQLAANDYIVALLATGNTAASSYVGAV